MALEELRRVSNVLQRVSLRRALRRCGGLTWAIDQVFFMHRVFLIHHLLGGLYGRSLQLHRLFGRLPLLGFLLRLADPAA